MTARLETIDGTSVSPEVHAQADAAECPSALDSAVSLWSDMVATLRERLGLDSALDDAAIALSLQEINRFIDPNARWQAAFDSTLGHWLALNGRDLQLALAPVVARRAGWR